MSDAMTTLDAWRLNVRDRMRTPETNLSLPTCNRVGECGCGAIVAEYSDGSVWNWWTHVGAVRTRHDCIGEIVHQLAEIREEREAAVAKAAPVQLPPQLITQPVTKPQEPKRARSALEL